MKFYGNVTFVIQQEDPEAPGDWKEYTIVKPYKGEWKRFISKWTPGSKVNDDKRVNNELEIIADSFSIANFTQIRCVEWMGHQWSVPTVTLRLPRLVLEVGDIYNAGTESFGST
jgi:hypothetical protein